MTEIVVRTKFQLVPMDATSASQIVQWRYEPPYDVYNIAPEFAAEGIEALLNPDFHYYAVRDERNELIAFRCFGADARVMGWNYPNNALDLGGGLRPDLTGRGLGPLIMKAAMQLARAAFAPAAFRVTVANWNQRAVRACVKVGYRTTGQFLNPNTGVEFLILTRKANLEIDD